MLDKFVIAKVMVDDKPMVAEGQVIQVDEEQDTLTFQTYGLNNPVKVFTVNLVDVLEFADEPHDWVVGPGIDSNT